ncbi:MoxR-like ATPase [Fontimonas thermophila]|uniref:MoxR-like ATPase n=1 Tax=Fontimonas thermophila TaxID=1076937 RepID=A0A1I2IRZ6_9GAMM|nr:MoxR family ATPase [Fontimonas thermophila]SFF44418.1 MoxR-like ATPase [Fontimonas thermophila]
MGSPLQQALHKLDTIILGKHTQLRLAMACLLARGHLLIEDIPGVGKTTMALALGRVLGLEFQRIQFTSDLLPADILGVSVYESREGGFRFHPGPIFAQLILADEVNRASPKTQSALLEAMEERQVTVEGATRKLPEPFFVIATQNPAQQIGTFPLPESQLDRFLMRIALGYPDPQAERALLQERERRDLLQEIAPAMTAAELITLQQSVKQVRTSPALIDYLLALIQHTRELPGLRQGLSPRAGLALRRAAQAWALIDGRSGVIPEDVQAVFAAVVGHRLVAAPERAGSTPTAEEILAQVAVP